MSATATPPRCFVAREPYTFRATLRMRAPEYSERAATGYGPTSDAAIDAALAELVRFAAAQDVAK